MDSKYIIYLYVRTISLFNCYRFMSVGLGLCIWNTSSKLKTNDATNIVKGRKILKSDESLTSMCVISDINAIELNSSQVIIIIIISSIDFRWIFELDIKQIIHKFTAIQAKLLFAFLFVLLLGVFMKVDIGFDVYWKSLLPHQE